MCPGGYKILNENYLPTNFLKNQRATVNIHRRKTGEVTSRPREMPQSNNETGTAIMCPAAHHKPHRST